MAVDEEIRNCMESAFMYFEKLSKVIPLSHGRKSNVQRRFTVKHQSFVIFLQGTIYSVSLLVSIGDFTVFNVYS